MWAALLQRDSRTMRRFVASAAKAMCRVCVGALVGVIFILTALVGVHELAHLQGRLDPHRCAMCQWSYGTSASVVTSVVALVTTLTLLGQCPTAEPTLAVETTCQARSPRAPPGPA